MTYNIYIIILLAMGGILLMVISFILISIRSQNKMLRQRQQMQQAELVHQKELLQAVIESQEAERKRIGQDLHDDVGTALSSLRLTIEMLHQGNDEEKYINLSKEIIDKVVKDVRHIAHNLSPPLLSYYGLAAAIQEKCSYINQAGQLAIRMENEAIPQLEGLELTVLLAFYRVLEELINNTIKHAGASEALIKFIAGADGEVIIEYTDNGKGMGEQFRKKGMGLQNIESRLEVINATYKIGTTGKGFGMTIQYGTT